MTFEEISNNLAQEKRILMDMVSIRNYLSNIKDEREREFYSSSLDSFKKQLRLLNDSIPNLLNNISYAKKLNPSEPSQKDNSSISRLSYTSPSKNEKIIVSVNQEAKDEFASELSLGEATLKRLKRANIDRIPVETKSNKIIRISSLIFGKISDKLSYRFSGVKEDLKEANIRMLLSAYISLALFVSLFILIFSLILFGLFSLLVPGVIMWIWVPFVFFGLTLVIFYFYPALEKSSVRKRISDELPFATIYMAAIAGSNMEPLRIFKTITSSPEYPAMSFEIKKIINQVEIYGYDLVTALKEAAKRTSNSKLSELLGGMATNIVSGGSLKNYLSKKSENLLVDYRLDRQEYAELAGTFMDIYISVLIAAPLVMMMMFIVMNLTGMGIGIDMSTLMVFAIIGIAIVNVIFMVVLHIKQPKS